MRSRSPAAVIPASAIARRRQPNNCWGFKPYARATADTLAPGAMASSTIRSRAADDHRRRGVPGLTSSGETVASRIRKLLSLMSSSDGKLASRKTKSRDSVHYWQCPAPDGVAVTLTQ